MASTASNTALRTKLLNERLNKFLRDKLPEVRDAVVRKVAFDVTANTAAGLNGLDGLPMRIDTGRLKGGWRVAMEGQGPVDLIAPRAPNSTSADGSYTVSETGARRTVTVSNNVEYARYIEDGTSEIRPGNHLKRALRMSADDIRKELAKELGDAWRDK